MTDIRPVLIDDETPGVRTITLNRPHRLNAFDGQALIDLLAAIKGCEAEALDIRVVVIRGNGKAFCSGNDLKWLASGVLADTAAHLRHQDRMAELFDAIETSRQVVVASVHGHAVAGGFELALAADIRIVADDAQLGDAHLVRNLMPSGGSSQRLPRLVGLPRAMYYLLSGRCMSGCEAERIGLAALAVSPVDLAAATQRLAIDIARTDGHALATMKMLARRSTELPLRDGLALERWGQFRYRNESPALLAAVHQFAGTANTSYTENT